MQHLEDVASLSADGGMMSKIQLSIIYYIRKAESMVQPQSKGEMGEVLKKARESALNKIVVFK